MAVFTGLEGFKKRLDKFTFVRVKWNFHIQIEGRIAQDYNQVNVLFVGFICAGDTTQNCNQVHVHLWTICGPLLDTGGCWTR